MYQINNIPQPIYTQKLADTQLLLEKGKPREDNNGDPKVQNITTVVENRIVTLQQKYRIISRNDPDVNPVVFDALIIVGKAQLLGYKNINENDARTVLEETRKKEEEIKLLNEEKIEAYEKALKDYETEKLNYDNNKNAFFQESIVRLAKSAEQPTVVEAVVKKAIRAPDPDYDLLD